MVLKIADVMPGSCSCEQGAVSISLYSVHTSYVLGADGVEHRSGGRLHSLQVSKQAAEVQLQTSAGVALMCASRLP